MFSKAKTYVTADVPSTLYTAILFGWEVSLRVNRVPKGPYISDAEGEALPDWERELRAAARDKPWLGTNETEDQYWNRISGSYECPPAEGELSNEGWPVHIVNSAAFCKCVCGHPIEIHMHYRQGTDCASCDAGKCNKYVPAG